MTITTHHGDCTALLPTLPPRSVQCAVTSPPYFGLRAYQGTTLRVAESLGRDSIGIELGDYEHLQQERTAAIQREMELA
jgi:DNA modification methylase